VHASEGRGGLLGKASERQCRELESSWAEAEDPSELGGPTMAPVPSERRGRDQLVLAPVDVEQHNPVREDLHLLAAAPVDMVREDLDVLVLAPATWDIDELHGVSVELHCLTILQ
jgi:hypothetical protein